MVEESQTWIHHQVLIQIDSIRLSPRRTDRSSPSFPSFLQTRKVHPFCFTSIPPRSSRPRSYSTAILRSAFAPTSTRETCDRPIAPSSSAVTYAPLSDPSSSVMLRGVSAEGIDGAEGRMELSEIEVEGEVGEVGLLRERRRFEALMTYVRFSGVHGPYQTAVMQHVP